MKNLITIDERVICAAGIKKPFKSLKRAAVGKKYRDIYVAGDDSFVCDFMLNALADNNSKLPIFRSINYVRTGDETAERETALQQNERTVTDIQSLLSVQNSKNAVFFFADCIDGLLCRENTVSALKNIFRFMKASKRSRMVVTLLMPKIDYFSDTVTALSERELNFYLEKMCDKTPELEYYLELEKLCREAVRDAGLDITLLRYDNIFSASRYHTPSIDLEKIVKECFEKREVVITDDDCKRVTSVTYIENAVRQIFGALKKAKTGHIYNMSEARVSADDIKQAIYEANKNEFSLSRIISAGAAKRSEYNCIDSLKFKKLGVSLPSTFKTGIGHLVSYITECEYDNSGSVEFYNGKIKNIQALETKILLEIDRICRKHNIKYFLAGGSLLGAVREHGAIEWDDDLDIGMLREDLEKFRKVCETELSDGFYLSGPLNKSGSHYTLDKIRMHGTYFSTNYSSHNVFRDGVFCDVLVYDKTSNNRIIRRIHRFILAALTVCNDIKWYGSVRRHYHYRFSLIALPILKLIPWGLWHRIFEFFATLFKNQKNTKWLIDSAGKKVNDDPLPNEGFGTTVYIDYEDIAAPVPEDSYPYLNWVYGENYMQKPPLSQRRCPHNFGRIDLGKYVFDIDEERKYRDVDIRGELFESDTEI